MYIVEWQIKLLSADGKFLHNVYIICGKVEKIGLSTIKANGITIDFILEVGKVSIYA